MTVETVVYTQPVGGGSPIEEFPAEIIRYTYRLNRPGSIDVTLPLGHPKTVRTNLDAGVHELVVRRNNQVVWAGPVLTVDEEDGRRSRKLTVRGEGLMAYLRRWHVTATLIYGATDQTTGIAWGLINHHQSKAGGNFGIVNGAVASGRNRDRTYWWWEAANIAEALIQLSEVDDGFDFDFRPDRTFVTYYPRRGSIRSDVVFDERNIRSFSRSVDATEQASQVIGLGAGEGSGMLLHTAQSSAAVATHKLTQTVGSWKDVAVAQTLIDHTTSLLTRRASPPNLIAITVGTTDPPLFSYAEGDVCQLRWPSPYDPVDEMQRLVGRDVVWSEGEEQAVLYLEPL